MPWTEFKENSLSALDTMVHGARLAVTRAGELGRVGVLRVEIINLQGKLNHAFHRLGREHWSQLKQDPDRILGKENRTQVLMAEIDELMARIEERQDRMREISTPRPAV